MQYYQKNIKKFRCSFILKSQTYYSSTDAVPFLVQNGIVSMSLGRMNTFDGVSPTSQIGTMSPVYLLTSNYTTSVPSTIPPISYYASNNSDNNDFYIDYPQDTTVNISFLAFNNTLLVNMPNYILTLTLEGILESELDHSC